MNTYKKLKLALFASSALLAGLMLAAGSLKAQSTDASRYVNSQGVEVIQGRRQTSLDRVEQPAKANSASSEASAPVPGTRRQQATDEHFQISAAEQDKRDRDRLAILQQELMSEATDIQTKWKVLNTPSLKATLSDEAAVRLRENIHAHESNLRALNTEISRVQAEARRGQGRMQ
jgi:hypothetical protein